MSADVTPVRAWAEYDEWSGYMEFREQWLEWTWAEIPKGASGELYSDKNEVNSVSEAVGAWGDERGFGPLRSLRVLLSNGHEIRLDREAAYGVVMRPKPGWWFLSEHGQNEFPFQAATDAEAVDRALVEATAWFAGQPA